MPSRRPTMRDVARAAGVHQTTVSLALRNDPRLPIETRGRVQAVALKLGYAPDPMLSALNAYRTRKLTVNPSVVMAFLADFRGQRELVASYPHRLFLDGARSHAEKLGYRLEVFYVRAPSLAGEGRLEKILIARGITGMIIGAFGDQWPAITMNWDRFSAVLIESQQLGLPLHVVSSHQTLITRAAVRRLHSLGYARIGLAVGGREEIYLKNAFTAGYYVEIAQHPGLVNLPPCLLRGLTVEDSAGLAKWVRLHALDAVVTNWQHVPTALRRNGWRIPEDLIVASLDLTPGEGSNAGMRQNHRLVGERAVEQLALLMTTNQRGLVESPNHTLIEGAWVDGTDVPARAVECGRAN